jgi:glycosyltransferase involved in cell wall biosynthesis
MTPPTPTGAPDRGASRIVMFLNADPTNDSRVLREARALADAGYALTLVARTRPGDPDAVARTDVAGVDAVLVPLPVGWRQTWTLVRTPWRQWRADVRGLRARRRGLGLVAAALGLMARRIVTLPLTILMLPLSLPALLPASSPNRDLVDWLLRWRFGTLAWNRAAADAAPTADAFHGHDLTALPAAAWAARRHGARLVYDSHEVFMESGRNARRPRWARGLFTRLEKRWAGGASAIVTVNEALAAELRERLGTTRVVAVHNAPPRWSPPDPRPDLLREAAAIPASAPIALYHGRFFPHRGMDELARAILEPGMDDVHAVLLGFGPDEARMRALAAEPRFGGRLHVLPGVSPDELLPWVASADVGVSAIAPSTLNHRLSTPNKLFECLAAGVPVVISDLPGMRAVVLGEPDGALGAVAATLDPAGVARAIRSIVDLPAAEAAALRARCLRAAHERWNWETESARLVALYRDLVPHSSR